MDISRIARSSPQSLNGINWRKSYFISITVDRCTRQSTGYSRSNNVDGIGRTNYSWNWSSRTQDVVEIWRNTQTKGYLACIYTGSWYVKTEYLNSSKNVVFCTTGEPTLLTALKPSEKFHVDERRDLIQLCNNKWEMHK